MNNSYGFKPKSGNQQEDNDAGESKYQTGLDLSKSESKKDAPQSEAKEKAQKFKNNEFKITSNEPNVRKDFSQKYKNKFADNVKSRMTNNSVKNDLGQDTGKKGDQNFSFDNSGTIDGNVNNYNNDYSVNIAALNNGSGGSSDQGSDMGFTNMQSAAAYTALNNNQHQASSSQLSGRSRAQEAINASSANVGANQTAANLYNNVGYTQNYWRQKSDAQQNFYLGDIFGQQAPEFKLPESPNPIEDNTEELMEKGLDAIKG